jgi:serine/threonine protein kinase
VNLGGDKIRLSSKARGTNTYRAPELIEYRQFSRKTDVWAIGCIIFRIATMSRRRPFQDDFNASRYLIVSETPAPALTPEDNMELVRNVGDVPFYKHLNAIIEDCFKREYQQRPTAVDLYERFKCLREKLMVDLKKESMVEKTDDPLFV